MQNVIFKKILPFLLRQLETQLFASSYIWLVHLFEVSYYSTMWHQWLKDQASTNQNSINRWCLIARRTICWTLHCWLCLPLWILRFDNVYADDTNRSRCFKRCKKNSFMNSKIQIISTLMKSIDLDAVKTKFYSFIL